MTDLSGIQSALNGAVHDLVDNLLGELLSIGPNQHTRLLRLHTPLGRDVLLAERARISEAIGPCPDEASPFAIELLALSTRADIPATALLGQPVLLELLTAHDGALRPFHGHVLRFELLGSDGGYARYRLRIGAWLDLLRQRTDAWLFQDMSVLEITESVFADYVGQATLQPAWRWDLKDSGAYPRLSTLSQYHETDFAFLQRLWAANGLFCWFEHDGQPDEPATLGRHTLVIADHNGAFQANAQARMRFTQPGATMSEDSITHWHGVRRTGATTLHTASFDYRAVCSHAASAEADSAHDQPMPLVHLDQPGAYAYETPEEADRQAQIQLQRLQSRRKRFEGRGTVRTMAPGTHFELSGHAEHDAGLLDHIGGQGTDEEARFVALRVVHQARNNLCADAQAGLQHLLGDALLGGRHATQPGHAARNDSAEPLYAARFEAQRVSTPVRPDLTDDSGALLHPKPTAWGTQTALVVGLDSPIHTDRDGRVKVQFHWQRGASASHRLDHPAGCNAPASDTSGTWVRVAQDWAGTNWGGVFIPRLGQEVVVAFAEGDIDRPLVIGTAYNGQGSEDAPGNAVAGGAANATGNAPAWFPGSAAQDPWQGHAHAATLSGFKSQSLDASQDGAGGHNQLVFDDTPEEGRVLLHTTQHQTWLQIGHLLQQQDNQRLARRGHGLELHTQAWGALRAGSGLHLSSHARQGGTASIQGQPTHTREAQSQLAAHAEMLKALSGNAQTHLAQLPAEPAPDKLPAQRALQATLASLQATRQSAQTEEGSAGPDEAPAIDGGHGRIAVTERADLVLSAQADISGATPAHAVIAVGQHATVTAAQDTNLLAQRHSAWAAKNGLSLFTRGESKDSQRAVQDVGIKLHAASGNVNVQAQSDTFTLTAEKTVDLQSTAAHIELTAPDRILLNGGGGYLLIEGGNIEIASSGQASFLGTMKELTGGGSASPALPKMSFSPFPQSENLPYSQQFDISAVLENPTGRLKLYGKPYRIFNKAGKIVQQGMMTGQTHIVRTSSTETVYCEIGGGDWEIFQESHDN